MDLEKERIFSRIPCTSTLPVLQPTTMSPSARSRHQTDSDVSTHECGRRKENNVQKLKIKDCTLFLAWH